MLQKLLALRDRYHRLSASIQWANVALVVTTLAGYFPTNRYLLAAQAVLGIFLRSPGDKPAPSPTKEEPNP